ncbi:MAG: tRNA (adenosine(37)-N6)-threonylcarbamoyltransferase complex ATPase subunit type 1 TsaE [Actinomycetes bacterium]
MTEVTVRAATPDDAADVREVTRAAFAGQETLDPPSGALRETVDDVAGWIAEHGGLVAVDGAGSLVGALRFMEDAGCFSLRRVAVRPDRQGTGVGAALLAAGDEVARRRGHAEVHVGVRAPRAEMLTYWLRRGFRQIEDHGFWLELVRAVPVVLSVATAAAMRDLGRALAGLTRPGDLIVLSGDLGAGKTTLTQGIGDGLGVRGPVTSPTFVIARVHPSLVGGPPLVHADAYRLNAVAEIDDLDLDESVAESVTVVEWGTGLAEGLADDRLEVVVRRSPSEDDETRRVSLRGVGERWRAVQSLVGEVAAEQAVTNREGI